MKKITLKDIEKKYQPDDYSDLYYIVRRLIDQGELTPIRSSGTNGKSPALAEQYRAKEEQKDLTIYEEEMQFALSMKLNPNYYLDHMENYLLDRRDVMMFSKYVEREDAFSYPVSLNERSYEIFGKEKFLSGHGKKLLANLGYDLSQINIYETREPLSYYIAEDDEAKDILITENLDPFYTIRDMMHQGENTICGIRFHAVVYGGGKRILNSFQDASTYDRQLFCKDSVVRYWGDLDFEGMGIFESFAERYAAIPFKEAYIAMIKKAKGKQLAKTAEKQNRNTGKIFLSFFSEKQAEIMRDILLDDLYIPQEILNAGDYRHEI